MDIYPVVPRFISNNQNHKYKNSPKTCMIKKYRLFSFMIIKHGL